MPAHRLRRNQDWETKKERDPYEVPVMGNLEIWEVHDLMMKEGVDAFAYEAGSFCNGPVCVDCGQAACWHHDPTWILEPCPSR